LLTSVSDIETERKTIKGKLYHVRYPFADGSGQVVVATTRPETMLGDVAVAVHPSDSRYTTLVGKMIALPLQNREIPLIADQYPDPEFGTGAVKITPAHDPFDYEVGQRHSLDMLVILDEKARVVEGCGVYSGLDRYEARKRIVADLEEGGFLEKVEDHEIAIVVSERSGEVVEPLLSEQWFVSQTTLAGPALEPVVDGRISITPARYEKVYTDWMENIRDWCISRQLWWGHRIPVYYTESGAVIAALSLQQAQEKAGSDPILRQDEDVLDTWFSSGLWPFATQGWPDVEPEFYPTSILVTDRNILYLWVARMVMMGVYFQKDIPFHEVLIHATVMTEDGKRMSKSLGTGVDPGEVIAKIGADALRYTLLSQAGMNQEIRYSERRTEDARNFANKIWNASRFTMMNLEGFTGAKPGELDIIDKWLLSRLASVEKTVKEAYEVYDFQAVSQALYGFFWNEYCDWYVEISKPRLNDPAQRATPQWVLVQALVAFLKMMHPIMPHITEEIYSHLEIADKGEFLMGLDWPAIPDEWADVQAESTVERWIEIIRAIRNLRAEIGVKPSDFLADLFIEGDLAGGDAVICSQAKVTKISSGKPSGAFVSVTIAGLDIHIPTDGLVDAEKELARLDKDMEKLQAELLKTRTLLAQPSFAERAKPDVVEKTQNNLTELEDKLAKTLERRKLYGG
ncbi:MAG: valine--tRNA ligase, partial [Armatimonadetes bacterium]|nr:valine--tRNA ligase [Armatimonadota bacterium]